MDFYVKYKTRYQSYIMIFDKFPIKTYGLPRSGTNFLEFMLNNNFKLNCMTLKKGWKHAEISPIVSWPTVTIIKNPYAWLVSLFNYATSNERFHRFHIYKNITFNDFLNRTYIWDSPNLHGPDSDKVFQISNNPIVHWNNLNKSWINQSTVTITYENLMFKTEETLKLLSKKLKIIKSEEIIWPLKELRPGDALRKPAPSKSNSYHKNEYYKKEKYMSMYDKKSLIYINETLDKEIMQILKYTYAKT